MNLISDEPAITAGPVITKPNFSKRKENGGHGDAMFPTIGVPTAPVHQTLFAKEGVKMPNSTNKEYVEHQIIDRLAGKNPSLKDVADGVRMIYSSLWGKEQLDDHIREIHDGLCAACKRKVKPADRAIKWAGWVILALVAILAKVLGVDIPAL